MKYTKTVDSDLLLIKLSYFNESSAHQKVNFVGSFKCFDSQTSKFNKYTIQH